MGFFEDLFGIEPDTKMQDQDIANDMIKDSKFGISSLVMAIAETTNPDMREFLKSQLNTALQAHSRLTDMAVEKEWYKPYLTPGEQVKELYSASQDLE